MTSPTKKAHQSQNDILLKSSKLENLHAASRFAQNEFKLCILDPATNELCFKGLQIFSDLIVKKLPF